MSSPSLLPVKFSQLKTLYNTQFHQHHTGTNYHMSASSSPSSTSSFVTAREPALESKVHAGTPSSSENSQLSASNDASDIHCFSYRMVLANDVEEAERALRNAERALSKRKSRCHFFSRFQLWHKPKKRTRQVMSLRQTFVRQMS